MRRNVCAYSALALIVAGICWYVYIRPSEERPPAPPVVFVDKVTGCEYLATSNGGSITPRMHPGGWQICRPPPKEGPR